MKHSYLKRVLALALVFSMTLNLNSVNAFAAKSSRGESAGSVLTYEKLDSDQVSAELMNTDNEVPEEDSLPLYADTDEVRAMIVLEDAAGVSLMRDGEAADAEDVAAYREKLEKLHADVAEAISEEVLDGEALDVVWSLTLAANAMSVEVEYGRLDEIAEMEGIKSVFVETKYMPMKAATNNIVAQEMTGAGAVKNESGYYGAGSRVAVIDTGSDTDHQSFDEGAYLYALKRNAEAKGMDFDSYTESLNLMTAEEIAGVLEQLNCTKMYDGELSAEDLYLNSKLPFAFNYIDRDLDVTHDNDAQGDHGSHVAGIATANAYIEGKTVYDFDGDEDFDRDDAQALMNHVILGNDIFHEELADVNDDGKVTAYDVYQLLVYLEDGIYLSAEKTVGVTGVASDAQLITMKVFGKNGGAYSSDYMAATEDAILLGCDAANLSLGSPYPGSMVHHGETAAETEYVNGLMEDIQKTGMVMSVAAGNSGNWADYDQAYGLMYTDEGGTYNVSDPSTYSGALSVASVDNVGSVNEYTTVFSKKNKELPVKMEEIADGVNKAWKTLDAAGRGTEYEVVFLGDPSNLFAGKEQTDKRIYAGSAADFEGCDYTGKVVFVARGEGIYFSDKHTNAAAAGAAAVVIYNNEPGAIRASIAGSEAAAPCAGLSLEAAREIYELASAKKNETAVLNMTVTSVLNVDYGEDVKYPTMSEFSSWGTTGALAIKPEITAPGGAIYSLFGNQKATDGYQLMSGTSMASPHVSGLAALASQYIREENVLERARKASGNEELTLRNLSQSLMMSTAKPLIEESSKMEYSVRNQGAGLADIEGVVKADSFLMVDGQKDGKVKAELGDGTDGWKFTFSVNNLTDSQEDYKLDAVMMTTDTVKANDGQKTHYLTADQMTKLGAKVTYLADGKKANKVTVPAGGSVKVEVSVEVDAQAVKKMEKLGYTNGFYVEGYLYVEGKETVHSIPMLGWYGNWTDPSMYDTGSYIEMAYKTSERPSHIDSLVKNTLTWSPKGYGRGLYYCGNIYGGFNGREMVGDARYLEERNAFNSVNGKWDFYAIFPTLIRASAGVRMQVTDANTGELYFRDTELEKYDTSMIPCFFYDMAGQWVDVTTDYGIGFEGWEYTDLEGNPLPEGTEVKLSMLCAPDYYVQEDGTIDWDAVGEGAELSYKFTVDNTFPDLAPVDNAFELVRDEKGNAKELKFSVQDNNYIASVILLNGTASNAAEYFYPDMDLDKKGTSVSGSFDLTEFAKKNGNKAVVAICDYAGNETYYSVNLNGDGAAYGDFVGFRYDAEAAENKWISFNKDVNYNETEIVISGTEFVCAEYINGFVFAETLDGALYAFPYEDMLSGEVDLDVSLVKRLENVYQDFAYSYDSGKLYGLNVYEDRDGWPTTEIWAIGLEADEWTGEYPEEWAAQRGGISALGLAADDEGTVYVLANEVDGDTYEESKTASLWKAAAEADDWGGVNIKPFVKVGDTGLGMDYLQSMTWNHNDEKLYWSRFHPESMFDLKADFVELNPETAEAQKLGDLTFETACLFAPLTEETAAKAEHQNVPVMNREEAGKPILSMNALTLGLGDSKQLECTFDPWYTKYKEVTWTSDNESVATVDKNGVVTGVAAGKCTVTAVSKKNPELTAQCAVTVASLSLSIDGMVSYTAGGLGSAGGSMFYNYKMENGKAQMTTSKWVIPEEFADFGTKVGATVEGRGSLWACEYGNTGMIYEIKDHVVQDVLAPIDGDMMFGMAYSEDLDMFTGIMNYYLYADQPLTHEAEEEIKNSYDEKEHAFTWHRFDMSKYLNESQGNLVTPEEGYTDIVFTGITNIGNRAGEQYRYTDYLGNYSMTGGYAQYTPDTTWVLLDNVGRMWYVDELTGMSYEDGFYMRNEGMDMIAEDFNGVMAIEYPTEEASAYSVLVIRELKPTVLYDQFLAGKLSITYTFSDLHYTEGANGEEMYFLSFYDYWNEGNTNDLYLFLPGEKFQNWDGTWETETPDSLYHLGNTGVGYMISTINHAELTGGLPETEGEASVFVDLAPETAKALGIYKGRYAE